MGLSVAQQARWEAREHLLAPTLGLAQNIFFSAVATYYILSPLGARAPLAPGEYGEF